MERKQKHAFVRFVERCIVVLSSVGLTSGAFLILPVLQTISAPSQDDLMIRSVDAAALQPPPPPPEIEQEKEEDPPEPPPELKETPKPLDLSQLELALNPGTGDSAFGAFSVNLQQQIDGAMPEDDLDKVFSLADLDQQPRAILQSAPRYPQDLLRQGRKGTVYVVFMVDQRGRVVNPKVERSTDPAFDDAALDAVKQWKFEPGTRHGEKVQFRMRIPITFNAG